MDRAYSCRNPSPREIPAPGNSLQRLAEPFLIRKGGELLRGASCCCKELPPEGFYWGGRAGKEESEPKLASQLCLDPVKPMFSFKHMKRKMKKVVCVSSHHLLPSFIMDKTYKIYLKYFLQGLFHCNSTEFPHLGCVSFFILVPRPNLFLITLRYAFQWYKM